MSGKSIFLIFLIIILSFLLVAPTTQKGKLNLSTPYETKGERIWFAKSSSSGYGDCTSWDDACTFRVAVSKCSSAYSDVIYLSPESHDLDNGSDANGTTISVDDIEIVGWGDDHLQASRFLNSAASVAYLLQVTGSNISIRNLRFSQSGQTDVNATHLRINGGDRIKLTYTEFVGDAGAASDIGILIEGSSNKVFIQHAHIDGFQDTGLKTNGVTKLNTKDCFFIGNVKAIDIAGGANDSDYCMFDNGFCNNTTAITTSANSNNIRFKGSIFSSNTTRVVDNSVYNGLHFLGPIIDYISEATYPANAGITVTGGGGAYAQGALTQIIPASTITTPFYITEINVQNYTASNVYKLELFYGQATGDNSIGIFEFTVGATVAGQRQSIRQTVARALIPSDSYIGAKLASSSGGGDIVDITLSYQAL